MIGDVRGFDRDKQIEIAHGIAEKLSLPEFVHHIYDPNEIGDFIRGLKHDEVALMPFLISAADKRGSGIGKRFFVNLKKIEDTSIYILSINQTKPKAVADLLTVRSIDGRPWYALMSKVGDSAMRGRALKSSDAKKKARKRHSIPGLVDVWKLKEGTAEYITHAHIWSNMNIKPAEKAIGMFLDDELRKASKETVQRIFGSRADCLAWVKNL